MVWVVYGSFYCLPFEVGNATSNEPTKYVRSQTEQMLQGTSKLISNKVESFQESCSILIWAGGILVHRIRNPLKEKTSMRVTSFFCH